MLTDDLIASLNRHAAEVEQPAADLVARVEQHAQRQHRRRIAAYASTTAVIMVAVVIAVGLRPHTTAHPSTLSPVSGAGSQSTRPMEYLTGSMCDAVGSARPIDYLDWPCVAPVGETALIVEERLAVELGTDFGSITHPLVRLIATDHVHNGYAYAEWWDADHPETPTQFIELDGPGTTFGDAPIKDPDLIRGQQSLFVRQGITSVTLEPRGTRLPFNGGVAAVPDLGNVALENSSRLVGRDSAGQTRPSWSVTVSAQATGPGDALCASHAGVGTCSPNPNYSIAHEAALWTGDCTTPAAQPLDYISWPCATEVDRTTPARVSLAVKQVVATHIGVREPRARLLADSRDAGGPAGHGDVSLVEVWDEAGTGPAVVVTVNGTSGSDKVLVRTDNYLPSGDPAGIVEGDVDVPAGPDGTSPDVALIFTRNDIADVHYRTDDATTPVTSSTSPAIGGVTSFTVLDVNGTKDTAAAVISGSTAAGATVFTTGETGNSGRIPCGGNTGVRGSTCVPEFPGDLPTPTTTAAVPTS